MPDAPVLLVLRRLEKRPVRCPPTVTGVGLAQLERLIEEIEKRTVAMTYRLNEALAGLDFEQCDYLIRTERRVRQLYRGREAAKFSLAALKEAAATIRSRVPPPDVTLDDAFDSLVEEFLAIRDGEDIERVA